MTWMTHDFPGPFQIQAHPLSLIGPFRTVDDEQVPQHIQKIPQLVQHKQMHDVRAKLASSRFSPQAWPAGEEAERLSQSPLNPGRSRITL